MKRLIQHLLVLIVVSFSPIITLGQGQFTTIGTDFWLGFNSTGSYYELKLVSTSSCTVTLSFTDGSVPDRTISIAGEGVTSYVFNYTNNDAYNEMTAVRNTSGTSNKSVRITSTAPIGVYAINQQSALTDATSVLPVTNYGTKYIAFDGVTMGNHKYIIISPEDNNNIYINGGSAIPLNKGQVYAKTSSTELSGDIIMSDSPVAFFIVSHELRMPTSSTSYTDQAFEQLPPVSSWGKEFLVPITERASEFVRVIASMDNTTVTFAGTTYTLNTGETMGGTLLEINAPTYISADKPIGVCTFMVGSGYKSFGYGDPSISWVPSIDQHMKSATITPFAPFAVPSTSTQLNAHWGQVVAKTAYKDETKVNGEALSGGSWVDGPLASGLSVYNMPFLKADGGWEKSYTFSNDNGIVVLGYGTGSAESYQYLAASSSRKLDAYFTINDLHYEDANLEIPFDCGTPFNFKATIEYELNLSTPNGYVCWFVDGEEVTSARNQTSWTMPYMSAGNHEIILQVTDEYNQVEEMKTTLDVECSTGISPTPVAIDEGEFVTMTIELGSGVTPVPAIFHLTAVSPSDADPLYYSFPSSVTMLANTSSITFTVSTTINNIINENDRLLKIKASSDDYPDMFAEITIQDVLIPTQRIISLNADPISINELPGGIPNTATVTVALPSAIVSAEPVRVDLSYTGSTATYNDDYSLDKPEAIGYIDIPANQNSVSFIVTAKQDYLVEGDEAVMVKGIAPTGYAMSTSDNSTTITIKDITAGDIIVKVLNDAAEPSTNGKFWIGFKDENVTCINPIVVNYVLTGTAVENVNYSSLSPYKATIPIGQNGVEIAVGVVNNFIVEGTRTLKIEIISID